LNFTVAVSKPRKYLIVTPALETLKVLKIVEIPEKILEFS